MAFTYTDSDKIVLEAWGKFKVTLLEACEPGDLLSFYNGSATYAVQFADQSDSQRADCIAVDGGVAGDEITAALKAVCSTIPTISNDHGDPTVVYFAGSTDYLGAPLYLGESGKPSTTPGSTFFQQVGKLIKRDQILIDLGVAGADVEAITLSGSSGLVAKKITVTDTTTQSSGYSQGLAVAITSTGDKTGSAEIHGIAVDMTLTGANAPYAYVMPLYLVTSGNPTIGLASALSIYIDDLGTACAQLHMLDLMYGSTNAPTTRNAYIRCRNHSDNTPTAILYLQANNNAKAATNFIEQDSVTVGPVAAAVNTGTDYTPTYKVRCLIGSTTFYLTGVAES
uniref:Uncharacterized protein n=1 Tax=viral metagenome TaxID=1070528 RepID=A0A6M3J6L5_9ZZZZ